MESVVKILRVSNSLQPFSSYTLDTPIHSSQHSHINCPGCNEVIRFCNPSSSFSLMTKQAYHT